MEEGRNFKLRSVDIEEMQRIKKKRPPILSDMKYFVMRKTVHFEKFRYQIARENSVINTNLNQLNIAAENSLGNFHLSEYDVRNIIFGLNSFRKFKYVVNVILSITSLSKNFLKKQKILKPNSNSNNLLKGLQSQIKLLIEKEILNHLF